jgi:hypothetical protein
MSVADQCRKEAAICRKRAERAPTASMRSLLCSVARTWLTLAERMDGTLSSHRPLHQ